MKKTIVIIGNSQLSFFVAKHLDEAIGNQAHMEIIWLTTNGRIFPVAHGPLECQKYLEHVQIKREAVKSVSLRDSRVITSRRTIEYDLAFIDQTPVYTAAEREKIVDQFETLLSTLRSNENRGVAAKARVTFSGADFDSLGLALAFNDRKNRDSSAGVAALRIEAPSAKSGVANFVKSLGVSTRSSQFPGINLKKPLPIISSTKIRGLSVDLAGQAMTLSTLEPVNHQNVFIVDYPERQYQNIARSDWQLAKQITGNIRARIEGGLEKPVDFSGERLILKSDSGAFVLLGTMSSSRNRARVVYGLDRQFWRKLLR